MRRRRSGLFLKSNNPTSTGGEKCLGNIEKSTITYFERAPPVKHTNKNQKPIGLTLFSPARVSKMNALSTLKSQTLIKCC